MSVPTSSSSSSNSSNFSCPNGKVRIFIRSPTIPSLEGFSILISLDSSVLTLKQAIFESHPLKPIVSDQKLIYRGRVLNDPDTIINILRDGLETDQTFHLVIKPSFQAITETTGIPTSTNSIPSSIPSSQQQRNRFPQGYTSTSPNTQLPDQNNRPNGTADPALQNPYNYYNYQYPYPYSVMQQDNSQQPISINQNSFPMGQYYYAQPPQIGQIGQIGIHAPQPFAAQVQEPPQDAGARNQRRASTFLYQTGRLRIVRRRRQRFIVPLNELFAQQPQAPIVQQNQEAQPNVQVNSNNNIGTSSPEQSSENTRSITLQDIEHGVWTFITSLIPTNAPDVGQQEDVGM
ncbi:5303_t:CDS:2 [Diversispora eburnea]|uniref:5303_t:CDS:1 n=1 Tax=Diversispora eburnea TaxID=1213867 RepID=A0A9N8V491_9GLOM|nr:5303_t:CDS:2 [Diversispora eburnea]